MAAQASCRNQGTGEKFDSCRFVARVSSSLDECIAALAVLVHRMLLYDLCLVVVIWNEDTKSVTAATSNMIADM